MRFTNAIWDENARLNTVSPAGQMEAVEDDVLPAVPELNIPPRHVKKYVRLSLLIRTTLITTGIYRGDIVSYQNYVLARMPEVWGKDATVFNPYRWFDENGELISYSPYSKSRSDLGAQRRQDVDALTV